MYPTLRIIAGYQGRTHVCVRTPFSSHAATPCHPLNRGVILWNIHFKIVKKLPPMAFWQLYTEFVFGRGSAPDPAVRELTALPNASYSWFTGTLLLRRREHKRREREGEWRKKGKKQEGKGRRRMREGMGHPVMQSNGSAPVQHPSFNSCVRLCRILLHNLRQDSMLYKFM